MKRLIVLVRKLRGVVAFKLSARLVVVTLMILGVWVATKKLDFPTGVSINDKLIHAAVFFGFAVLVDLSSSRKPFWLWKGLPLLLYGIGIEVMQYFTPFRSFSLADMLADLTGILIYFGLKVTVLHMVKNYSKDSEFL